MANATSRSVTFVELPDQNVRRRWLRRARRRHQLSHPTTFEGILEITTSLCQPVQFGSTLQHNVIIREIVCEIPRILCEIRMERYVPALDLARR